MFVNFLSERFILKLPKLIYSRINSRNSPASGEGKISESRLMSQVGRVREIVCA